MRASNNLLTSHAGYQSRPRRATWRLLAAAVLAGALGLTAACGNGGDGAAWRGGNDAKADDGPKIVATVTSPAADATNVPASAEITFKTENATDTNVEVKAADGTAIDGAMREDGSSWLPTQQLKYNTQYSVTVTATGADGKTTTTTSTFTTMAKPTKQVRVTSFLGDGQTVGVGMPIIIKFSRSVPKELRDEVQRRMFVTTTPRQEGTWHWVSGAEVRYRPKVFWKANTKVSYRIATGGLPMGGGFYGRADITVDFKIGSALIMTVDDKTKKMTVTKDGKVLRTIPVSLGKPSTPSSSGTMLIIDKQQKTIFDTFAELGPELGYRTPIEYAQRLTWGGEFIHAAPWSVAAQGHTNVSHGCVNMSTANAAWLFNLTKVGDPITVKGTERKLQMWNGWTDWNMSWADWVKDSAIPYAPPTVTPSADPSAAPTDSPSPGATPAT